MGTFIFKTKASKFTPLNNIFIDKFMASARGEFVKVYILGLKYCYSGEPGVNIKMLASHLNLLESEVMNAWNFWGENGVVNLTPIDSVGNYNIEFLDLDDILNLPHKDVTLLNEINKDSNKGMLSEIEKLIARPLSSLEMTMYLGLQKDLSFSPEIILMLIEYCVSKGKTDHRYIEKIALDWCESKIKSVDDAQIYIKKHEDKWISMRKILTYLGIKDGEIMKPQEMILDKWINTYKMPLDLIFRACDICFERINKADFKYIDKILSNWNNDGVKTTSDIALIDPKKKISPKSIQRNFVQKPTSVFHNFEQRTYDYDKLERELLGWDNNDK